jgi:protein involved in sex pheromone biosynthesis
MKKMLMISTVLVVSMFMSCAIFISDNDDDTGSRNSNSSKDTITIIYSQTKGNPLSVR